MYNIETYKTSSGREPLEEYMDKLTKGGNYRAVTEIKLAKSRLCKYGRETNRYFDKLVKHIQDDLYELRPGQNRVFFFYFDGSTIVLLHAFKKESKKTPKEQINKALQEMQDYKGRH